MPAVSAPEFWLEELQEQENVRNVLQLMHSSPLGQ